MSADEDFFALSVSAVEAQTACATGVQLRVAKDLTLSMCTAARPAPSRFAEEPAARQEKVFLAVLAVIQLHDANLPYAEFVLQRRQYIT